MRQINWSGMKWNVKSGTWGPGPNYWSDSIRNVWIDIYGRLHLKIVKYMGKWYCAEIFTAYPVGLGNYMFNVRSNPAKFANNVVGGLFYYLNDQNEIDIEFSRWEDPLSNNTLYSVWTPDDGLGSPRFETDKPKTTHLFRWDNSKIYFESKDVSTWTYTGPHFPMTGGQLHINLWLIGGKAPINCKSQELILSNVEYSPG